MTMTVDPDLWEDTAEKPELHCGWRRPLCSLEPLFLVTWSCGCTAELCLPHKDTCEVRDTKGPVNCMDGHGYVTLRSVRSLR